MTLEQHHLCLTMEIFGLILLVGVIGYLSLVQFESYDFGEVYFRLIERRGKDSLVLEKKEKGDVLVRQRGKRKFVLKIVIQIERF